MLTKFQECNHHCTKPPYVYCLGLKFLRLLFKLLKIRCDIVGRPCLCLLIRFSQKELKWSRSPKNVTILIMVMVDIKESKVMMFSLWSKENLRYLRNVLKWNVCKTSLWHDESEGDLNETFCFCWSTLWQRGSVNMWAITWKQWGWQNVWRCTHSYPVTVIFRHK